MLDMSDHAVKCMIKQATQRGFVTVEDINNVLPEKEMSSEEIEDILAILSDMGVTVVENDDEAEDEQQ
jgi:RNA polymerase primary sigma factor